MYIIILVLFYVLFPVLLIYATSKSTILYKIGAVVLAYGIGLILGNAGIFPAVSDAYHQILHGRVALPSDELYSLLNDGTLTHNDFIRNQISATQDLITTIAIPLAIPLLLFSLDIRKWFRLAGTTFLSLILALISVVVVVFAGYFIFRSKIPGLGKIAGMLIGIYSGGTPNLASIKAALHVDPDIFIMTHTTDIVIGAVCLLFLLTVAQKFFRLFLPPFKYNHLSDSVNTMEKEALEMDNYSGIFSRRILSRLLLAVALSAGIFAIGGGLGILAGEKNMMAVVILTITTLGLILGLVPAINRIEKTYQAGMYLIIVFCLVVSSMADLRSMLKIEYLDLMMYVALVYFGSLLIHILLSMIFRIDADTVIITSTALVYSPPFVPVVAGALRNREVIISGLTTGVIGYIIGNYLGIFTGFLLMGSG
jgi:uncharacterized membrane protein